MQYVVDDQGWWALNCFACHSGKVAGKPHEGVPNSLIALETLYADMRKTKLRLEIPLSPMDVGSAVIPMGTSDGTTNAVVFGIALMAYRDKDLNYRPLVIPEFYKHHDMDAPAWWNLKYRPRLYIDGFVEKNVRAMVPFVMEQVNSGETLRNWEDEFTDIYNYVESLEPPAYPFPVDQELAAKGRGVFRAHCAKCHGTYGANPSYPSRRVPIDEIGTDRVRLDALSKKHRLRYHESWYAHYATDDTVLEPDGYVAPPLHGIWASAPYFHNGSVPTLWHVMHADERPTVWKRSVDGYDSERVGLEIVAFEDIPAEVTRADEKRRLFDTRRRGKNAAGHRYPENLSESEKRALLEFLKTL